MYLLINNDNTVNFGDDHPIKEGLHRGEGDKRLRLIEFRDKTLKEVVGEVALDEAFWDKKNERVIRDPSLQPIETSLETKMAEVHRLTKWARARVAEAADRYKVALWADKAQRALRVLESSKITSTAEDMKILELESETRGKGETALELAEKQHQKAVAYVKKMVEIDGMEAAILADLRAKKDEDERRRNKVAEYRQWLEDQVS